LCSSSGEATEPACSQNLELDLALVVGDGHKSVSNVGRQRPVRLEQVQDVRAWVARVGAVDDLEPEGSRHDRRHSFGGQAADFLGSDPKLVSYL